MPNPLLFVEEACDGCRSTYLGPMELHPGTFRICIVCLAMGNYGQFCDNDLEYSLLPFLLPAITLIDYLAQNLLRLILLPNEWMHADE